MKRFQIIEQILLDHLISPLVRMCLDYTMKGEIATECSILENRELKCSIFGRLSIGPHDQLVVTKSKPDSVILYDKNDTLLVEWKYTPTIGVAFHPKRLEIYTANIFGVYAYDLKGKLLHSWYCMTSHPLARSGIAVHNERIFVTNDEGIDLFTTQCKHLHEIKIGKFNSLAILNDELYASDFKRDCICVFDLNGKPLRSWGGWGRENDQFHRPDGIAHYDNLVYVADRGNNRIQVFQPDGTFVRSFAGRCGNPNSIAISSMGRIYVGYDNGLIQTFQVDVA
jgi:hypothetical protein